MLCFEAVSGLRVSFFKSEFIGIKVNEDRLQLLADLLGSKAGDIPNTYFGLPLCNGVASKSLLFLVLERLEKRLSLWKKYYLSFGGRITLIKAALANLPIYFISIFKCPVEVIKCMEKLQKDFLWHGNEKKMTFHSIKWTQVCKSEEYGGSGIRSLKEMNLAPDGKWLWRIGDGSKGQWKHVIFSKYDIHGDGWQVHEPTPQYSALWKGILTSKDMFFKQIRFRVGKGDKIFFWTDLWVGEVPLAVTFPELFRCASNQNA